MARSPTSASPFTEIGVAGLNQSSGYVREEYLRELVGPAGIRVYREMGNDAVVGAILFAATMLLRSVDWEVVPRTAGDTADEAAAAFISEALFDAPNPESVVGPGENLEQTFSDVVAEILSFLQYGWSLFEVVYKRRSDGRVVWKKFGVRAQETLVRWQFDEHDEVIGFEQRPPSRGGLITIPMQKCLLFRTTTMKNNPEGRSLLRSAYRAWYFRKRIEEVEGIGVERDLAGLPVAYVPATWTDPNAPDGLKQAYREIKNIVRNVRRDEQEGLVLPHITDDDGKRSLELTLLTTNSRRQFDTSNIVQRYDQRIAMTILADFILLGHEKVGSFALSSDKTDLFAVALGGFLQIICDQFNKRAIPDLLGMNVLESAQPTVQEKRERKDPTRGRCELRHKDIESADLAKLKDYVKDLVNAGVLLPDVELERYMRSQANLPELPEEIVTDEDRTAARNAAMPPMPAGNDGEDEDEDEDRDEDEPAEADA